MQEADQHFVKGDKQNETYLGGPLFPQVSPEKQQRFDLQKPFKK